MTLKTLVKPIKRRENLVGAAVRLCLSYTLKTFKSSYKNTPKKPHKKHQKGLKIG